MQWLCCPDYTPIAGFIHVRLQLSRSLPPLSPATPPRNGSICPLRCVAEATTCNPCSLSVLLELANLCRLNFFFLFESVLSLKPVRLHPFTPLSSFFYVSFFFFMCPLPKRSLMSSGGTWTMWFISFYCLHGFWHRFLKSWHLLHHGFLLSAPYLQWWDSPGSRADFSNSLIRFHARSPPGASEFGSLSVALHWINDCQFARVVLVEITVGNAVTLALLGKFVSIKSLS